MPSPRCAYCGGVVLTLPTLDRWAGAEYEELCMLCSRTPGEAPRVEYPLVDCLAPETAAALAALAVA